jgi:hypothetical protein
MIWRFRNGSAAIIFALSAVSLAPGAYGADFGCEFAEPVTGGTLRVLIVSNENAPTSIRGAIELSTLNVAPPLGFRNGTYAWDLNPTAIAANGAMLGLNFEVSLPMSEMPGWGAASGSLVPTELNFLLPNLISPTGAPIHLNSITLISGNGIYNSNNEWRIRSGEGALLLSNAPETLSLVYSRELLQMISADPNEPISLFLSPAVPAALDSIVSFHAGGIIEAPERTQRILQDFIASNGACPAGVGRQRATPPPEG